MEKFTEKEMEVLVMLDKCDREHYTMNGNVIAEFLGIAHQTVRHHIRSMNIKTDTHGRLALLKLARRNGWLASTVPEPVEGGMG